MDKSNPKPSKENVNNSEQNCPFCNDEVLNLEKHFNLCDKYQIALSKDACTLCNEILKSGRSKGLHWKDKCSVINKMKQKRKCI